MPEQQRPSPQPQADAGQVYIMFFLLMLMLVLFNPELRGWMGDSMGSVLEPYLGFDKEFPVMTIFLAGFIMIVFSTSIRHIFIDWMEMARIQKIMYAFNKEMREAQISQNQRRVEKLVEFQPEIMKLQADLSSNQMKPMMFTMLIAIPIFMWLHSFIGDLPYPYVTIPWNAEWDMTGRRIILPNWVWIYSFLSLPIGQTYMRFLKIRDLKRSMNQEEENLEENTVTAIKSVEKSLDRLKKEDVPVEDLKKELEEAIDYQKKNDHKKALRMAESVKKKSKERLNQMDRANEHLRSLEDMRKVAKSSEKVEKDYEEARESFRKGDYASAMYYAKQAKKVLIEAVAQREYRDGEVTRIRDVIEENSLDPSRIEACIGRAKAAKSRDDFDEHIDQADRELDNILKEKDKLMDMREDLIRKIGDADLDEFFDLDIEKIDSLFEERNFVDLMKTMEELNLRVLRRIKSADTSNPARENL